jgi:hypothetical protein
MSEDRGFHVAPAITTESVSQRVRRRSGGRKRIPWRQRDWVFAFLALPVFTAVAVAAFEAARNAPPSAVLASVMGALVGAPAGVLTGGLALVAFLVAGPGGGLVVEGMSGLGRRSRQALLLMVALGLEWFGSGVGGSIGLIIHPGVALAELDSAQKTAWAWLGGTAGLVIVWLRRRLESRRHGHRA